MNHEGIKIIIRQIGMPGESGVSKMAKFEKEDEEGNKITFSDHIVKVYDENGVDIGYVTSCYNVPLSMGGIFIEATITNDDIIKKLNGGTGKNDVGWSIEGKTNEKI